MENQTKFLGNTEVAPQQRMYATVIHVCGRTTLEEDKSKALQIAFQCYNKIIANGIFPLWYTYHSLLLCIANLLPEGSEERAELSKQVFEAACGQGQVDRSVILGLEKANPSLLLSYEALPEHSAMISEKQDSASGKVMVGEANY